MRGLGWILLALVGCGPRRAPSTGADARWEVRVERAPDPGAARDPTRAVLVTLDGRCPAGADGWTVSPLFPVPPVGPDGAPVLDVRARFCLATGQGGAPLLGLEDVRSRVVLLGDGLAGAWERRVAVSQTALSDEVADGALARAQVAGGAFASAPEATGAVRLVVLDAPEQAEVRARLAQGWACAEGEAACPVRVAARAVGGDRPATLGELAAAIAAEVDAHVRDREAAPAGARVERLVLDVGLAWHPVHDGGHPVAPALLAQGATWRDDDGRERVFSWRDVDPATFAPDVRAVWDALGWARCVGVVVIAPDGEASAGPESGRGPLLPAGWQAVTPDALPRCHGFGLDALPGPTAPLVWAVGAASEAGEPWGAGRRDTVAPLLAVGEAATLGARRRGPAMARGSGVASAVVSAAVGRLWAQRPELPAGQVVQRVIAASPAVVPVEGPLRASVGWLVPERLEPAGGLFGVDVPQVARPADPDAVRVRSCEALLTATGEGRCVSRALPMRPILEVDDVPTSARGTYPEPPVTHPACGDARLFAVTTEGAAPSSWPCPDRQRHGRLVGSPAPPEPCHGCALDVVSGVVAAASRTLTTAEAIAVRVEGQDTRVFTVDPAAVAGGRLRWAVPTALLPLAPRAAALVVAHGEGVEVWDLPLSTR